MKRNFLILFSALLLIAALAFVTAPAVKAETAAVLTPADLAALDNKITENGLVLDLQGQNLTVEIVGADTVLSVIDTKNTALSGEGAGELTVVGEGSVALETVDTNATNRRSFLRIQNDNGTYSFHPIYLTIKQIGVNTYKSTLCLQALFVTNEIAQAKIETGVVYTTNDGQEIKAPTGDAFSFKNGFLYSYYDLMGSLVDENGGVPAVFETKKSFKAYISVNGEEDATVYREISQAFSPKEVMEKLNEIADSFSDVQKEKLVNMITGKAHLETLCGNFLGNESTTPIVADGKYYIVAKYTDGNYYAMTDNYAGNAYLEAKMVALSDGAVTDSATAWTLTNDGEGNVTLMSPKGVYLMRENGSSNILVGETAEKWLVAKDETTGTYTLQNTNTDSRYLSYNGTGFKAYAAAREDRVIELLILPANEAAPDEGDPDEGAPEDSVIPNGQYYVIAQYTDGKYYAMTGTFDAPNGCMAVTEVAVSDGVVTGDATAWTVANVGEDNVTLMSPDGVYLTRQSDASNVLVGDTATNWLVVLDEATGTYTLQNTNTDSRYLSYNGTGFKAYAAARQDRVIELLIIPVP